MHAPPFSDILQWSTQNCKQTAMSSKGLIVNKEQQGVYLVWIDVSTWRRGGSRISHWGTPTLIGGGANLWHRHFSAKTNVKRKEFCPVGGGALETFVCRSATVTGGFKTFWSQMCTEHNTNHSNNGWLNVTLWLPLFRDLPASQINQIGQQLSAHWSTLDIT